jgi:hypothetical protein
MKKVGFGGVAEATTLKGEVTLAPAAGLDTVSGKSFDPAPHAVVGGLSAVGAGNKLVLGDQLIATGGVDGNDGGGDDGGGVGVGGGVMVFVVPPQLASMRPSISRHTTPQKNRRLPVVVMLREKANTARITTLQKPDGRRRNPGSGAANRLASPIRVGS